MQWWGLKICIVKYPWLILTLCPQGSRCPRIICRVVPMQTPCGSPCSSEACRGLWPEKIRDHWHGSQLYPCWVSEHMQRPGELGLQCQHLPRHPRARLRLRGMNDVNLRRILESFMPGPPPYYPYCPLDGNRRAVWLFPVSDPQFPHCVSFLWLPQ